MVKNNQIIYFHNGSFGDFLMTLHLCENIHDADKNATLIIIVPRYEKVCRELAMKYRYISVIHVNRWKVMGQLIPLVFQGNVCITPPTPGRIPLSTKIAARLLSLFRGRMIGFDDRFSFNKFLYTTLLDYDIHKLYFETMHDIVKALKLPIGIVSPTFHYTPSPDVLQKLGVSERRFIVLHPFGSSDTRSLHSEDILWLVKKIKSDAPGIHIVITGSENDRKRYQYTLSHLVDNELCIVAAGKLSMPELATLLDHSDLYIGVDTGVSHLASVLRKKSIIIAHTSSPPNWLPYYNQNAIILYHIQNDPNMVYEGREYLFKNFYKVRCLEMPPREVIYQKITEVMG